MSDNDQQSKRPYRKNPPKPLSNTGSAILAAAFFTACGSVIWGVLKLDEDMKETIKLAEAVKSAHIVQLNKYIEVLEQEDRVFDIYISKAKDGQISSDECTLLDGFTEETDELIQSFHQDRESVAQLKYISAAQSLSYKDTGEKAYSKVTMKAGQLRSECDRLFATPPAPQPQPQYQQPEWWQKVEIQPNYDKRELMPDYLK